MRECSDRARNLAHAQIFRRGFEALQIASRFLVPDGELQAEGDRLGVNAMRAADLHGVLELERAPLEHLAQLFHARDAESCEAWRICSACAVSTTSVDVIP